MPRVFAESATIGQEIYFSPATTFTNVGKLVTVVVSNVTALAGLIAFIFIVIAGFGIITGAGGDPKKLEQSKQTLTWSVAGLIIVVFALWIMQALKLILGVDPLNPF